MSGKLYSKSDQLLKELKGSQERIEKLSIEYNPLNQIRSDLRVSTNSMVKDYENSRKLVYIKELQDKFKSSRVIDVESILLYSVKNDYTLESISEYRSELSDKSIEAIQIFADKNGINIAQNKDNFFILAPRKYFKKTELDESNVAFNIYYHDGFTRGFSKENNLVEVYGSNFKDGFFSPFNEMMNTDIKDSSTPFWLIAFFVLTLLVSVISAIVNDLSKTGMFIYNFFTGVPLIFLWLCYWINYSDKSYIRKGYNIREFFEEGKTLKISR